MRILPPFDPIGVREVDTFAFDVTERVGSSEIVSTQWRCVMTPFFDGVDPHAEQRVGDTWVTTRATNRFGQQLTGWFVFAIVGPMPAVAAGGTYVLQTLVYLADGRILSYSCELPCVRSVGTSGGTISKGDVLWNDGGVLALELPVLTYPSGPLGLPAGAVWSNGGLVSVVPGMAPDPQAPPIYFNQINATTLLSVGAGNLPLSNTGNVGQLWNDGGIVAIV